MTEAQQREFVSLANRLSPENLYCDGEISRAEAGRRYKRIVKRWRELEEAVGYKVSEAEVWALTMEGF
jgi:hypothetical protein